MSIARVLISDFNRCVCVLKAMSIANHKASLIAVCVCVCKRCQSLITQRLRSLCVYDLKAMSIAIKLAISIAVCLCVASLNTVFH